MISTSTNVLQFAGETQTDRHDTLPQMYPDKNFRRREVREGGRERERERERL
jgi:hypothetical protein